MTSVQDRVQAGMAWLDEAYPDHVKTFDPSDFDIMNGFKRCVLMQATGFNYWSDAQELAGLDDAKVQELGFFPIGRHPLSKEGATFDQDIDDLNAAWLEAYAQRQAA